ncbi:hypothetical protein GXM_00013 [Nostoc sphaeroides CCNUC1]|uniref:Uncharacterized protein n=1 Tax=Nostoc sphaeroides CCNUC1 TaxID=2653204 RepID=A0A5P8VQD3_9NOSO|nr:hypothetical protein GXM_00013 [Nostoc sphaeroides CCNUC1]
MKSLYRYCYQVLISKHLTFANTWRLEIAAIQTKPADLGFKPLIFP